MIKTIFKLTVTVLLVFNFALSTVSAQAPQSFKYQAVVRDGAGTVLANQMVGFQLSILKTSETGTSVYSEAFTTTTNSYGLVNLMVGEGTVVSGDFTAIDWAVDEYFLKVELDETGGTSYVFLGTSKLNSVPYALNATNSDNTVKIQGNDVSINTPGSGQVLKWNGTEWAPADDNVTGGTDVDGVVDGISVSGTTDKTITLSRSNGLTPLTANYTDEVDDADNDIYNELQVLNFTNDTLYLSDGGQVYMGAYGNLWEAHGNDIYNTNTQNVGVGLEDPMGKFVVQGDSAVSDTLPLFEVKNKDGITIFAVYDGGVRVYVRDDGDMYANNDKSGFAVGGYRLDKSITNEYMRVTPDSVRIYIKEENTNKANNDKGGFAVGGYRLDKTVPEEYLNVYAADTAYVIDTTAQMLWYPLKEAFLSGKVLVEHGDSVGQNSWATGYVSKSIGDYSQALGYQARAFGNSSTSIGYYANSIGANSYSFGNYATAQDSGSYAIGSGAKALGLRSFAFGSSGIDSAGVATAPTTAQGDYSYAMGMGSVALNEGAFAFGTQDTASGKYSLATGYRTVAYGNFSTAIGSFSTALERYSTAIGFKATASGDYGSTSIGYQTTATGNYGSVAMGMGTEASGSHGAFAMGYETQATGYLGSAAIGYKTLSSGGYGSVAMGTETEASGQSSIAIGDNAIASGDYASTAIGYQTEASGAYGATAIGYQATASGQNSASMGNNSQAIGNSSIAIGLQTKASGYSSLAMGAYSIASNNFSTSIGYQDTSSAFYSTALGYQTMASGTYSTSMGRGTIASNQSSTAMGDGAIASGSTSTAMGVRTIASGSTSTAMGVETEASGAYSTSMGYQTIASGGFSTTMGNATEASGSYSIAGGQYTKASGSSSTALGYQTEATNSYSTALGYRTTSNGNYGATSMGYSTTTSGDASTAIGYYTTAKSYAETVIGRYNDSTYSSNMTSWLSTDPVFIIGNGGSITSRHNAMLVRKDGEVYFPNVYSDVVGATNRDLYIDDAGKIGYLSSAKRFKKQIKLMENIDWLYKLRPVNYLYKLDKKGIKQYGLIAEDVEKINPLFVSYNKEGVIETVNYSMFITPMLKAIQDLNNEINKLKIENKALNVDNTQLKNNTNDIELLKQQNNLLKSEIDQLKQILEVKAQK